MDDLKAPRNTEKFDHLCHPGRVQLTDGDGEGRIEHVLVKEKGRDGIRFSWWNNGLYMKNALELPEPDLLKLFQDAIRNGVFSSDFIEKLSLILRHP